MASVRTADAGDVAGVVALARAMHAESPVYRVRPFDPHKTAATFLGALPAGGAFVAESGGRIVGLMVGYLAEDFFGSAVIAGEYALYVLPEARGGTSAVRLLEAFEAWARRAGAVGGFLGVTAGIDDERVAALYMKLGYRPAGAAFAKEF